MPLEFDELTHAYKLDGQRLPSVTQIIKAILPQWEASEWAMQRGTATHHGAFLFDCGVLDWSSVDAEIEPRIRAWEKFRRDYGGKIVANEERLSHPKLRYACCIDRILERGGEHIVCDLKSSFAPQSFLQIALYSVAWTANGNKECGRGVVVELNGTGDYSCFWLDKRQLRRAEQQAVALLTVYSFAAEHDLIQKRG